MAEAPIPSPPLPPSIGQAIQALKDRRPADAIGPLREAAQLQPSNSRLRHDLGLALLETGAIADALAALKAAVAIDPRYSDAHFRIGIALEKLGDLRSAVVAYERATGLDPTLTEAWFRAGALVHAMGHREEAIGCFRRAAQTGPKTRFGRLGAARALLTEDRDAEAEAVLRKALERDPSDALAHDLLGNLLAEWGRFDEAYGCFMRAVALAPLLAGSYYDLVRCRRIAPQDRELIERMAAALDTPGLEAGQRQRLHLALGKAADDLGDHGLAMRHFDAADALREGSASFDSAAFDAEIDRLIARCTPERMVRAAEWGSTDATPILIIGMPRSGTTLVEQIISSHPDVGAAGELNFWNELGGVWHQTGADGSEAPFLRRAATHYLRILKAAAPKSAHVTDKMPFNFLWAGLIHLAFPRAVFVHCRRTAADSALSIHQTLFHPGLAFPTGGVKLVAYFKSYERLMEHWRKVLPSDRLVEVDYERLTRAPEPEIRRLIAGCGLEWNDACLKPERNPRPVKTPSKWQTRQPINPDSVSRWKRYEPWLGPLRALVAETEPGPPGTGDRR
jgi:tetratricopeptide (TPR) repeat protein